MRTTDFQRITDLAFQWSQDLKQLNPGSNTQHYDACYRAIVNRVGQDSDKAALNTFRIEL